MSGADRMVFSLYHDAAPLQTAREQLTAFLANRTDDVERNRILLAVEEALVNTFEHGYAGGPGSIEVLSVWTPEALRIELSDRAREFDPTSIPLPSPEELSEGGAAGGYGLFLLRSLMKVEYSRREGGGNTLVLIRKRGQG